MNQPPKQQRQPSPQGVFQNAMESAWTRAVQRIAKGGRKSAPAAALSPTRTERNKP